tara:strand:- start:1316 stop:1813 length:498 start_codon:yes stop_codon:yes gene_type:complete
MEGGTTGGYIPEEIKTYQGKQVLINSDRLVFNAKEDSILLYSDKAIGFSTNGSIHFDTGNEELGVAANNFIVNSPNIYLGLTWEDKLPSNPAVLGDELGDMLEDILELIDSLIMAILYKISYQVGPKGVTGPFSGNRSMVTGLRGTIEGLKKEIKYIKSERIKIV